jgi:pseudouridylate synthase
MNQKLSPHFIFHPEIVQALRVRQPLVALESTVITHGLPYPENLDLATAMEAEVRSAGAIPATIGVLEGKIHIGLTGSELEKLASGAKNLRKISRRDLSIAIALHESGGTTVAATLFAAHAAGIQVLATGGIGGVHRGSHFDVSADLPELGRTPLVVVCAGAKAILDLPTTLEYLETMGIPVIGYQTSEFPAFYSRESGLPVAARVETPAEITQIAMGQWSLALNNAILVTVPPPEDLAIPSQEIEELIQRAVEEARAKKITGNKLTPFLLERVSDLSHGASKKVNIALLLQNARIAAQISKELAKGLSFSQKIV